MVYSKKTDCMGFSRAKAINACVVEAKKIRRSGTSQDLIINAFKEIKLYFWIIRCIGRKSSGIYFPAIPNFIKDLIDRDKNSFLLFTILN